MICGVVVSPLTQPVIAAHPVDVPSECRLVSPHENFCSRTYNRLKDTVNIRIHIAQQLLVISEELDAPAGCKESLPTRLKLQLHKRGDYHGEGLTSSMHPFGSGGLRSAQRCPFSSVHPAHLPSGSSVAMYTCESHEPGSRWRKDLQRRLEE